jgi:hypothetical protein
VPNYLPFGKRGIPLGSWWGYGGDAMKYLDVPQSGSQSDTVASRNRFGQYYRTRATGVNPNTGEQSLARTRFGLQSNAWRSLTEVQRSAWEVLAGQFPIVDSLGQEVVLTGAQMFVRSNSARLRAGDVAIVQPGPFTDWSTAAIAVTATAGTPSLSIAFTVPATDQIICVDVSPPKSPGVYFNSQWRRIVNLPDSATTPSAVLASYNSLYGALIEGQVIFFRSRTLNEVGVFGPALVSRVVIAA